jgi:hypothetical protein
MNSSRRRKRGWKETRISLAAVTAVVFDGPGSDWLLVIRGRRTSPLRVGRNQQGGRS